MSTFACCLLVVRLFGLPCCKYSYICGVMYVNVCGCLYKYIAVCGDSWMHVHSCLWRAEVNLGYHVSEAVQ